VPQASRAAAKDADARGDRSQTDRDDLAMIADAANAVKSARCYPWRGGGSLNLGLPPRESNDTPREKAFCRVAPSVRLSDFAILAAGVL